MRIYIEKLRIKILFNSFVLINSCIQFVTFSKKRYKLMQLFIKTKELRPIKTIFLRLYIPQTSNGLIIFR